MSNQDSDDPNDNVRRSARSNKGKHSKRTSSLTKQVTIADASDNNKNDDEGGEVKCICGATDVQDGDQRSMCECENCLTWQHVQCMLGKDDPDIVPDGYLCNDCSGSKKSIDLSVKRQVDDDDVQKRPVDSISSRKSTNSPSNAVAHISDLKDKVRQSVAIALKKIFVSTALPEAIESKKFSLPADTTSDQFAEKLSLDIESALYKEHAIKPTGKPRKKDPNIDVGHKYRDKFRSLSFNLRDDKNPGLRLRIIIGELTPKHIAELTSEEMLNPELQKLAESVRKESIRESVLKVEDGPRIRKTHKGDEIIEMQKDAEYHETKPNAESENAKKLGKHAVEDTQEENQSDGESRKRHKSTTSEDSETQQRKSVDYDQRNFRYEDVATYSPAGSPHQSGDEDTGTGLLSDDDDMELNELLDDDDNDDDDKPQSKTDGQDTKKDVQEEIGIWIGNVSMAGISQFPASALHLQGADNFNPYDSWSQVMDLSAPMVIDGRLDEAKAGAYLYAIRNTKAIVSAILKSDEADIKQPAFNKIFDYYHSRKKIGIIKNRKTNVKDSYLIALSSTDPVPAYLALDQQAEENITRLQASGKNLLICLFVASPFTAKSRSVEPIPKSPMINTTAGNYPTTSGNYSQATSSGTYSQTTASGNYSQVSMTNGPYNQPALSNSIPATLPNLPTGQFGLSSKDFDLLKGVLAQNPEVASNPQLPNNPQLLLDLLQKTQGGMRR